MKRYYYNSSMAKVLLCCSTCHTIALAWFVLSKLPEIDTSQIERNHETIHAMQWMEVVIITGLIIFVVDLVLGISAWWYLISGVFYYVMYVVEWLCKLPFGNAYKSISFEQEAYENDDNNNYVENRHLVTGWLKKVFKVVKEPTKL